MRRADWTDVAAAAGRHRPRPDHATALRGTTCRERVGPGSGVVGQRVVPLRQIVVFRLLARTVFTVAVATGRTPVPRVAAGGPGSPLEARVTA